jgi:hypothetical protein
MKQCPACKTTYTDESLRYCLADGATLVSVTEEPTVFAPRKDAVRVDIPSRELTTPIADPSPKKSSSAWLKALTAFGVIGFLFVVAIVVAVAILYMNTGGRDPNVKAATPTPSQTPTPDSEKQRLQDELANLQKRLDEQKNANKATNKAVPFPTQSEPGVVTARVNSPNDGFLAMRNIPDSEYGTRLAKIPHGATVTLNNCEKEKVTIGGRSGRWCQVEYQGQTGWVFDAWLEY